MVKRVFIKRQKKVSVKTKEKNMADEILVNDPVPIGEKVIDLICLAWASRRPIILRGPHGLGKSEIVEEAADAMDINYRCMDLSIMEPPDLLGMPKIDNNVLKYFPPATLPQGEKIKVSNGKKKGKTVLHSGLLCFEELNRCDDAMQAPCLQLLTARCLNEYKMPSGWSVVACINPSGDQYNVNDIDPALLSRFMIVDVSAGKKEWLNWAERNDIHEAVINVVSEHPDPFNTKSGVPPRTWKYVSDILNAFVQHEGLNEQVLIDAIKGYLNLEWAAAVKEALFDMGEYDKESLEEDEDDDEEMVDPQSLKGKDKLPDVKELVAKYTATYRRQVKKMSRPKISANMELLANSFNNMVYQVEAEKFCNHVLKPRHTDNLNKLLSDIPNDAKQSFRNSLREGLRSAFKIKIDSTGQIVKSIQLNDPSVLRKNMINLIHIKKKGRGPGKKNKVGTIKTW